MGQYRLQRLNDQVRDEISKLILHGDVKDPRVNTFLSINRVEVTNTRILYLTSQNQLGYFIPKLIVESLHPVLAHY